jgi:predicted esterase YcpF (UPF0227 family)
MHHTDFDPHHPTTHLLYLHGFRSSPLSMKAKKMAALMAERFPQVVWWCPQLPASPREAAQMIAEGTATWPRGSMAVIGSSLGGFYATWLAEQTGCTAVLLNPAVHPARDLAKYIGEHPVWQSPEDTVFFQPEYVDELLSLPSWNINSLLSNNERSGPCAAPAAPRIQAIIAKGDEVLNWGEMLARYPQATEVKLLAGGDHALSDFDHHVDDILGFLNLADPGLGPSASRA